MPIHSGHRTSSLVQVGNTERVRAKAYLGDDSAQSGTTQTVHDLGSSRHRAGEDAAGWRIGEGKDDLNLPPRQPCTSMALEEVNLGVFQVWKPHEGLV